MRVFPVARFTGGTRDSMLGGRRLHSIDAMAKFAYMFLPSPESRVPSPESPIMP